MFAQLVEHLGQGFEAGAGLCLLVGHQDTAHRVA
jgi:hypothetical protein